MSDEQEQEPYDWGFELASLIAIRRTEGNVYMDGSHNPRPSEEIAARAFCERFQDALLRDIVRDVRECQADTEYGSDAWNRLVEVADFITRRAS